MILFYLTLLLCVLSPIFGVVALILNYEILGTILIFFVFLGSILMIYVLLSINTKKILKKNKIYNKRIITKNYSEIVFYRDNGVWKTNIDDSIALDLNNCILKYKYIEAFVTRLIRYNENKITVRDFFSTKYLLNRTKVQNLVLNINGKRKYIIKNGLSIQSVLSQLVSSSYFLEKFLFAYSAIPFLRQELKNVSEIDYVNKFKGKPYV